MKELLSEAGQWYEKALKLDKNHVGSHQGFEVIHIQFKLQGSLQFMVKISKVLRDKISILWPLLGSIMAQSAGYHDEAKRLCRIVLEAKPKSGEDVRAMSLACVFLSIMS